MKKQYLLIASLAIAFAGSMNAMSEPQPTMKWSPKSSEFARRSMLKTQQPISYSPSIWDRTKANITDWSKQPDYTEEKLADEDREATKDLNKVWNQRWTPAIQNYLRTGKVEESLEPWLRKDIEAIDTATDTAEQARHRLKNYRSFVREGQATSQNPFVE